MTEFEISSKFLTELAKCSEALISFSKQLSLNAKVKGIVKGIDCRSYDGKIVYEQFVEASLVDDVSICWWIDILAEQHNWTIEANVSLTEQSSHVVRELDSMRATTIEEFSNVLNSTLRFLLSVDDLKYSAS